MHFVCFLSGISIEY